MSVTYLMCTFPEVNIDIVIVLQATLSGREQHDIRVWRGYIAVDLELACHVPSLPLEVVDFLNLFLAERSGWRISGCQGWRRAPLVFMWHTPTPFAHSSPSCLRSVMQCTAFCYDSTLSSPLRINLLKRIARLGKGVAQLVCHIDYSGKIQVPFALTSICALRRDIESAIA
ncbi:uncharacterized protein CIMG_12789 [Coccidioides immitis RS]|uniref:Uncharacterized protein n=1 Tax=Coccidioides immitis (strain RS) TaxID=246410 RepID=J3KJ50_COCIM|nr:uncharacterized protein CIMG_12789 [Coccidioides immitis RS]EAS36051.3 hypothetical protein CIMG_12789 [Coccidioides immitis RS]